MKNSHRVVAQDTKGRVSVVVLGVSPRDCKRRLREALAEHTLDDLNQIEWLWVERWREYPSGPAEWWPVEDVPIRRFKLIANNKELPT